MNLTRAGGAIVIGVALLIGTVPPVPAASEVEPVEDDRPNILIIVTDDQRRDLMPAMPKTLELFRDQGRTYVNAFVTTPMCCPARASILTGRYAHNHRVLHNGMKWELGDENMLQSRLREHGYRTGLFGKFLNSWRKTESPPGFDRFGMGAGYRGRPWNIDGTFETVDDYNTDVIAEHADDFIRSQADEDTPWLAVVTPFAPHPPYEAHPDYEGMPVPKMAPNPAMTEWDRSDKPPWVRRQSNSFLWEMDSEREQQYRTLPSVDDLVERLFATLEETDQQNTLALFLSDNGYLWGEHGLKRKGHPYNDSVRVPFYVRWPGRVTPGSQSRRLVANIDIAPTVLAAAGIPASGTDGRDILVEPPSSARKRILLEYWCNGKWYQCRRWTSIRTVKWQYTVHYDRFGRIRFREYYDFVKDPWQLHNLLADGNPRNDPDIRPLQRKLRRDKRCAGATCP